MIVKCIPCQENRGIIKPAYFLAPQSTDQGKTQTQIPVCGSCYKDWWDGSDWVGKAKHIR